MFFVMQVVNKQYTNFLVRRENRCIVTLIRRKKQKKVFISMIICIVTPFINNVLQIHL